MLRSGWRSIKWQQKLHLEVYNVSFTEKAVFQCSTSLNKENDNSNEAATAKVRLTFNVSDNISYNTQYLYALISYMFRRK